MRINRLLFLANHAQSLRVMLFLAQIAILLFSNVSPVSAVASSSPTQGEFAVRLVEKLGLGKNVSEDKAMEILASLSIRPGVSPDAKWQKEAPATPEFVAQIQASIQMLLKMTALDLDIEPPPTLELYIFDQPPAAQGVYSPPETGTELAEPHTGANPQESTGAEPPQVLLPMGAQTSSEAPNAPGTPNSSPPTPALRADPSSEVPGTPVSPGGVPLDIPENGDRLKGGPPSVGK